MDTQYVMVCVVCGHTLSVEDWEALPDEVNCPECGVSKSDYEKTAV
jgi:rubredoxin